MYRRTAFHPEAQNPAVPIDHAKVCDGFSKLGFTKFYRSRDATCGVCGQDFILGALAQKEILERNGVPLKFLDRGGAFCSSCLTRRRRIKTLRRWRAELVRQISAPTRTAEELRAVLEARCTLLENFGEGDARKGILAVRDALKRFPEASLGDLHARLQSFASNRSSTVKPAAASELATLDEQEASLRAVARPGLDRDTCYPCDLDKAATCPHCGVETCHPLCVLDNAMICPRCDGRFELART